MERLIKLVLAQRLLVVIVTIVVCAAGAVSWKLLPIDAFPDVTNVQVMVLTEASGLAAADVEQQVTFPIELALQGLPDVTMVRSLSKSGLSLVAVIFEEDVDIYFARQLVFERVQAAREQLPEWAEPELGPISTGLGEIYQYTLESDTMSAMDLRTLQDWVVAPRLRALAGVNEVNSFGGYVRQYHVMPDPDKLLKFGVTLPEVLVALEANNANAGGDFIVKGWEQSYVRSQGLLSGIEDIEDIVLKSDDGTPVYVRDVAEVGIGSQTRQGAVTRAGRGETVAGMVIMLRGENSQLVVDEVKKTIPLIQSGLPEGVTISPFYDRTALIRACIATVAEALAQGGAFVIIVLFLFLGNFRASVITAVSLPVTASIVFVLMDLTGVTANLMSLGGLAIAIGMIVDGSIVITENISRHLAQSGPETDRRAVVFSSVIEVARPIVFSTLIIIVVFLPLFTLEQMEGKMFKPMALTMIFAMGGALVVSLTIVPALSSLFLTRPAAAEHGWAVRAIKKIYLPLLAVALRRKKTTVVLALASLSLSLVLASRIGTEFLPELDEGAIAINIVRLPTASLEGSVKVGVYIEQRLARFQEIETVVTKTGRAEISEDPMGPEQSDVFIMLRPREQWDSGRTKAELVDAVREDLSSLPGLRLSFSQPIALRVNELISGIKSDLAVKIYGPDLETLKDRANAVAGVLGGVEGAVDVKVEQISGAFQVEVVPDRRALARYGINVSDVNDLIEAAVGGKRATMVVEEQKRFALLVRFPEKDRRDLTALGALVLIGADGGRVPLGQVAEIGEIEAPAQISRENNMRRIVVECNVRGRDLGGFVAEVRERTRLIESGLPAGYFMDFGGQFENQQRAMKRLAVVVPVCIGLIFLMLFSAFGNARGALMVIANLPFALVGGIIAIALMGINLSVSAVIGFIALFGMAVENGIVLVTFFNQLRDQGLSVEEAVWKGCELRVRPLVMTGLTTLLGLAPMIYATGSGSEIQRPLAVVVIGGLISAMALTLLVLPVLYSLVETRASSGMAGTGKKSSSREKQ